MSNLVTTSILNTKIREVENKVLNTNSLMANTVLKLTAETFASRLKQANLERKTDFRYKLISLNRKTTSSKTKFKVKRKQIA